MSAWRRLLEEESEHQWLSFAVFTILIIIGALLIDSSSEMPGVREGGIISADGMIYDSAGDAVLYQAESGMRISLDGKSESVPYATCLVQHGETTYACLGQEGLISYSEEDKVELGWVPISLGSSITASQLSPNENNQMLIIVQDGTTSSIAAMNIGETVSPTTNHDGKMHLDAVIPTEEGWLVGGSWQAPSNWLGSNPASPPMFELILSVQWDGTNAPSTEIVHMGDEGTIHGIFATDEGYIATGTSDTVVISDGSSATSMGISSIAAVSDLNDDVWLFGAIGSTTVVIVSDGESSIEKLPSPLEFIPSYVTCNDEGLISIHGIDTKDEPSALSIDSNVRNSFTSLRGIMDLGFILVSLMVMGLMGWNITDAIRKGEIF